MLRFTCPICNKILKAPESKGGAKFNCPKCSTPLQVPSGHNRSEHEIEGSPNAAPLRAAPCPFGVGVEGRHISARSLAAVISGFVLLLLFLVGAIIFLSDRKASPSEPGPLAHKNLGNVPQEQPGKPHVLDVGRDTVHSATTSDQADVPRQQHTNEAAASIELAPVEKVTLKAGETKSLKIKVQRIGYKGKIAVSVEGLPPTVMQMPITLGEAEERGDLDLTAGTSAEPEEVMATVLAVGGELKAKLPVTVTITKALPRIEVLPVSLVSLKVGETKTVTIRVKRQHVAGDISVTFPSVPDGIQVEPLTLRAGQKEGQTTVAAAQTGAQSGTARILARAEGAEGTADVTIKVEPRPVPSNIQLLTESSISINAGEVSFLDVSVKRQNCDGPVVLKLNDKPFGVAIDGGKTEWRIAANASTLRLKFLAPFQSYSISANCKLTAKLGDLDANAVFRYSVVSRKSSLTEGVVEKIALDSFYVKPLVPRAVAGDAGKPAMMLKRIYLLLSNDVSLATQVHKDSWIVSSTSATDLGWLRGGRVTVETISEGGKTWARQIIYRARNPRPARGKRGAVPAPKSDPQVEKTVDKILRCLDTNKDGKISHAEAKDWLAKNFTLLDQNKDGFLDRTELRAVANSALTHARILEFKKRKGR